jgi:hypothetical protein
MARQGELVDEADVSVLGVSPVENESLSGQVVEDAARVRPARRS